MPKTNTPIYGNVINRNDDLRLRNNSSKSLYDLTTVDKQETDTRAMSNQSGKEHQKNAYHYYDSHKLNDKELNLILMAIEKFEKIEESKKKGESNRPSRYFYKTKQIYPYLDINAVSDPTSLNLSYNLNNKPKQQPIKQLELQKPQNNFNKQLINDLKIVTEPTKSTFNSSDNTYVSNKNISNTTKVPLSQVLKDIIIEYSNISEEEFFKFKTELQKSNPQQTDSKKDEINKQVNEQQTLLEQQKIPKNILDAYKNPYYEHCSDGYSYTENSIKRAQSELFSQQPQYNTKQSYECRSNLTDTIDMKRAQSYRTYNESCNQQKNSNLKRTRSTLKKLASAKDGEQFNLSDEELYDPTNFTFDEEIAKFKKEFY